MKCTFIKVCRAHVRYTVKYFHTNLAFSLLQYLNILIIRVCQGCNRHVATLGGCYKIATRLSQGCHKVVTRLSQSCYKVVARLYWEVVVRLYHTHTCSKVPVTKNYYKMIIRLL